MICGNSDKPVWIEHIHEVIKYFDKSDITFIFESNKYKNYIGAVKQRKSVYYTTQK